MAVIGEGSVSVQHLCELSCLSITSYTYVCVVVLLFVSEIEA